MGLFGGLLGSVPKEIGGTTGDIETGIMTKAEDIKQKTNRALGLCIILVLMII